MTTKSSVGLTMQEMLDASPSSDWQPLDPAETLYLDFHTGRVVIMLASAFAPNHIENIMALARENYFDEMPITRVQDNFVVQWGELDSSKEIRSAKRVLPPEFARSLAGASMLTPLPDGDVYAQNVGFAFNFPAAWDATTGHLWLTHCYGMVGVARGDSVDSGSGTALYVVIGQSPRYLDRNITLVGRVVRGIELLSALPRGPGAHGYYEEAQKKFSINAAKIAADLPKRERLNLEILRTDSTTFQALIENQRNRREAWFHLPAGHIDLATVPLPARERAVRKPVTSKHRVRARAAARSR